MNTLSIIINALLSGGLIVTLVTLKSTRRKAELENEKTSLETFQTYIVEPLKTEVNELRQEIRTLNAAIARISSCPCADDCPVLDELQDSKRDPQS